jgi:hypothetical protein
MFACKPFSYIFVRMQLGALHVRDDWPFTKEFNLKVRDSFSDKVSAYLRYLAEKDLSGATEPPSATSPDALLELARAFQPALVPIFAEWAKTHTKVTQGEVIANMLYALAINLKRFPDDDLFVIELKPRRELTIEEIGDLPHSLVSDEELDRYYAAKPDVADKLVAAVEKFKRREAAREQAAKSSIELGDTQEAFDSTLKAPHLREVEPPVPTHVAETLHARAAKSKKNAHKSGPTDASSRPKRPGS